MKDRAGALRRANAERAWLLAALVLTLAALAAGIQFVLETTGGTLFVFASVGPSLVVVATVILAAVLYRDFRRRHRLFDIESYRPGDVLFRQGDAGDAAYFIRSGQVEIVRETDGSESVLARLGAGQYFGEAALLSNAPRNATVRASAATEVAVLGKENFLTMLSLLPTTHDDVLRTVSERAMSASGG